MRGWLKVLGGIAIVAAILLIIGLILRHTGGPDADPTELVTRAVRALDEVAVKGTVVTTVQTPQGRRTVRAKMHRGDGRFGMRILSGPGQGARVYRQGGAVWLEREGGERVRQANVGEQRLRAELLKRNWTFTTSGTRRVAGRRTILVQGVGPGGSIDLAIDLDTGFPLHISRKTPQGEILSETTWVDADFSVQPPRKVEPPQRGPERHRRSVTLEEARDAVDFLVHEPRWLPEGWQLQGWFVTERRVGKVVQARFGDGLRPMIVLQLSTRDVREGLRDLRERRRERTPHAGEEEPPDRRRLREPDGGPQRRGAVRGGPLRRWAREHAPRHLRGAGADASRRVIDGTVVIVIGPVDEKTRERMLSSMAGEG